MALSSWLSKDVLERVTEWAELLAQIFGIAAVVSGAVYFVFNKPLSRLKEDETSQQRRTFEESIGESKVVAAKANERAEKLEAANLESAKQVAQLQGDASDSKAAQQQVEIELSKQRERAARAEADLLQLRKRVSPRAVNGRAFLAALNGQPKARVEIMYVKDDPDCFNVAQQLESLLSAAKWDAEIPSPLPPVPNNWMGLPTASSFGGQPSGVTVVDHFSPPGLSADEVLPGPHQKHTPAAALQNALLQSMGGVAFTAGGEHNPPEGTVRIVVAPRLW